MISLAFVIAGIYLVCTTLRYVPFAGHALGGAIAWRHTNVSNLAHAAITGILPLAANAVAAYIMIRHSDRLAGWALRWGDAPAPETPAPRTDLTAAAFAVVGVVIAALALAQFPGVAVSCLLTYLLTIGQEAAPMIAQRSLDVLVRFSMQFVLGVALFWKAHALAAYWRRIQNTSGPTDTPAA